MAHAIDILSFTWWAWIIPTFSVVLMLLFISIRANKKQKLYIRWIVAGILLLSAVLIHPYLYLSGKWSVQTSLPLHMCTIAQWLAIFALLKPRQWLFDILVFWGIAGGMNAILTPQPLHGGEFPVFLEYFVEHGGIIFVPLFLATAYQMRPSHQSWFRMFLYTMLVMAIMSVFNYYTGSNYFFTAQKPIADSPFILGDWPYYIIGFLLIGLFQFYAIYYFMNKFTSLKVVKQDHVVVFAKNNQ
jgi:hypothetical integral membrane protein (TIGR02206 family)